MSWKAYVPPWYPDLGPFHNPFAMNGDTGPAAQTIYADWTDDLERREGPDALKKLVAGVVVWAVMRDSERRCRECGCSWSNACTRVVSSEIWDDELEACSWVEEDLCTACDIGAGDGWRHP